MKKTKGTPSNQKKDFVIGFTLYESFDSIDVAGPYEVFSWLRNTLIWEKNTELGITIEVLAPTCDPPGTSTGLQLVPTSTFRDFSKSGKQLDMIFVPGGTPDGFIDAMQSKELIGFIQAQAVKAQYICSVCFGAFILGQAGLLKNLEVTTYWTGVQLLSLFPNVQPAPYFPRFVAHEVERNGVKQRIVTGGGISSGIDEALYLAELIGGKTRAQKVQLGIQYNPRPPMGGDPTVAAPELWEADLASFPKQYTERLKMVISTGLV